MGNVVPNNANGPSSSSQVMNAGPRNSQHHSMGILENNNCNSDDGVRKNHGKLEVVANSEEEDLNMTDEDIRIVRNSWKELQSNDLREYGTIMMIK